MPAHVTLIYPFVDDSQLVARQVRELEAVLSTFSQFDVRFATFGRFDGAPSVLYLEPDPAQPFVDMIEAIAEQFPDTLPSAASSTPWFRTSPSQRRPTPSCSMTPSRTSPGTCRSSLVRPRCT